MRKVSHRKIFWGGLIVLTCAGLGLFWFLASRTVSVSCNFDEPSYLAAIANLSDYSESVVSRAMENEGKEECGFECASAVDFSPWTRDVTFAWIGEYPTGGRFTLSEFSRDPAYVISMNNRVKGLGTDKPELMVVLPDVYEGVCNVLFRDVIRVNSRKIKIPDVRKDPHILNHEGLASLVPSDDVVSLPFIKGALQDKVRPYGCVRHDEKYYYYQVLRSY